MATAAHSVLQVSVSSATDSRGKKKPSFPMVSRRQADREYGSESSSLRSLATTTRLRHRVSNSNVIKGAPIAVANTYRLSPNREKQFKSSLVENVVRRLLSDELLDKRYDQKECSKYAQVLCERIKHSVKELDFTRYKIVCNVVLGEKKGQGVHVKSRNVWDDKLDSFAEVVFENGSLFAVATIYGAYFE